MWKERAFKVESYTIRSGLLTNPGNKGCSLRVSFIATCTTHLLWDPCLKHMQTTLFSAMEGPVRRRTGRRKREARAFLSLSLLLVACPSVAIPIIGSWPPTHGPMSWLAASIIGPAPSRLSGSWTFYNTMSSLCPFCLGSWWQLLAVRLLLVSGGLHYPLFVFPISSL